MVVSILGCMTNADLGEKKKKVNDIVCRVHIYNEGWGLSHGNYFLERLIDHEGTWKYNNRRGCC